MLDSPEPTGAQKARKSIVDTKKKTQKTAVQDPVTSPTPHTDLRACLSKAQVPGLNLGDAELEDARSSSDTGRFGCYLSQ